MQMRWIDARLEIRLVYRLNISQFPFFFLYLFKCLYKHYFFLLILFLFFYFTELRNFVTALKGLMRGLEQGELAAETAGLLFLVLNALKKHGIRKTPRASCFLMNINRLTQLASSRQPRLRDCINTLLSFIVLDFFFFFYIHIDILSLYCVPFLSLAPFSSVLYV